MPQKLEEKFERFETGNSWILDDVNKLKSNFEIHLDDSWRLVVLKISFKFDKSAGKGLVMSMHLLM